MDQYRWFVVCNYLMIVWYYIYSFFLHWFWMLALGNFHNSSTLRGYKRIGFSVFGHAVGNSEKILLRGPAMPGKLHSKRYWYSIDPIHFVCNNQKRGYHSVGHLRCIFQYISKGCLDYVSILVGCLPNWSCVWRLNGPECAEWLCHTNVAGSNS